MKNKPVRVFLILIFIISAIAGAGWWYALNARKEEPLGPKTAKVVKRDFSSTVLATGAIQPQVGAEVKVGARISGKVERLFANIGDFVKKGEVIAEIEKADLEATVRQREAEVNLAKAKLSAIEHIGPWEVKKAEAIVTQWQATLTLSKKEFARQNNLLKNEFTSQQARDQAQEKVSVARAKLEGARRALELTETQFVENLRQASAELERAQAALANVKVQLSYATITAPISGVIGSVSTQEGETVAAGLNAPTFVTIIDLNRLQVDAYVDEVDIGKVRDNQQAVFTVDTFPGKEFQGKVVAIYPKAVIQDNVVNYDVVIKITTPYEDLLRPEMTAGVTIFLESRKGVLAVPAKTVKRERGKNIVYLVAGDQAKPKEVKIGWKDGQWIEIADGLQEGQTVFLNPPAIKKEVE